MVSGDSLTGIFITTWGLPKYNMLFYSNICNSYTKVCLPVGGDNPQIVVGGLALVRGTNHCITILYHIPT